MICRQGSRTQLLLVMILHTGEEILRFGISKMCFQVFRACERVRAFPQSSAPDKFADVMQQTGEGCL
jgi:hypothetical protein